MFHVMLYFECFSDVDNFFFQLQEKKTTKKPPNVPDYAYSYSVARHNTMLPVTPPPSRKRQCIPSHSWGFSKRSGVFSNGPGFSEFMWNRSICVNSRQFLSITPQATNLRIWLFSSIAAFFGLLFSQTSTQNKFINFPSSSFIQQFLSSDFTLFNRKKKNKFRLKGKKDALPTAPSFEPCLCPTLWTFCLPTFAAIFWQDFHHWWTKLQLRNVHRTLWWLFLRNKSGNWAYVAWKNSPILSLNFQPDDQFSFALPTSLTDLVLRLLLSLR